MTARQTCERCGRLVFTARLDGMDVLVDGEAFQGIRVDQKRPLEALHVTGKTIWVYVYHGTVCRTAEQESA